MLGDDLEDLPQLDLFRLDRCSPRGWCRSLRHRPRGAAVGGDALFSTFGRIRRRVVGLLEIVVFGVLGVVVLRSCARCCWCSKRTVATRTVALRARPLRWSTGERCVSDIAAEERAQRGGRAAGASTPQCGGRRSAARRPRRRIFLRPPSASPARRRHWARQRRRRPDRGRRSKQYSRVAAVEHREDLLPHHADVHPQKITAAMPRAQKPAG